MTHGHEAGWAGLPVARSLLRRIGDEVDVVTYLGEYVRVRLARALSPEAAERMVRLTPGVDVTFFRPGAGGAAVRDRLGLGERPVVVCVSRLVRRKGQDTLIRAWPQVRAEVSDAVLLLVGDGPYAGHLRRLAGSASATRSGSPDRSRGPNSPATTTRPTCSRCRAGPGGPGSTSRASASSTWRRRLPACR